MKRRLKVETAKQVKVGSGADGLMPPISPPVLPSTGGHRASWRRNRQRLYVAPPPPQQHACTPSTRPAGLLETATAAVAGAQEDGHQDGEMEGGSWAKMALPAPPCPAPTTA